MMETDWTSSEVPQESLLNLETISREGFLDLNIVLLYHILQMAFLGLCLKLFLLVHYDIYNRGRKKKPQLLKYSCLTRHD